MKKGINTYFTLFSSTGCVLPSGIIAALIVLRIFRPNQIWVMIGTGIAGAVIYSLTF